MESQAITLKNMISKVSRKEEALLLSHSYNGYLFTQPAKYKDNDETNILLKVNHQIFCLCKNKSAILHSDILNNKIAAQVSTFDLNSGEVLLQDYDIQKGRWKNRREERIQPFDPIMGILQTRHENFRGNLENISVNGASFLLHISEINTILPKHGQFIQLFFNLGEDIDLNMNGKISSIRKLSNKLFSLGLLLNSSPTDQLMIQPFLDESYLQMTHQIDEACRKLAEPIATKDLYF